MESISNTTSAPVDESSLYSFYEELLSSPCSFHQRENREASTCLCAINMYTRAKTHIHNDLTNCLESEDTDIILQGKDQVQVKAHGIALSIRSKVFKAMLSHETKEKIERKIEIDDLDGAVLKEMVNYIYTDKVNDIQQHAHGLFYAAEKYDLPGLKLLCVKFPIGRILL